MFGRFGEGGRGEGGSRQGGEGGRGGGGSAKVTCLVSKKCIFFDVFLVVQK